ncbi:uncharacterized protein LOC123561433 [Mercenaria mercenaria]|uniref:uncharacterized protein LOC123561433 n=1 Tax=Mercenaria mercenaria TaxID=6596 RepID=UPI00234F2A7D|nr:uncharacterized protein LOC123561433 [Mercenaria mercenaria]
MSLSKLSNSLREKINPFSVEDDPEPKTRCIYCRTKERLRWFKHLQKGSHICMGGKKFMLSIGGHQVVAYTHHAIVKSVQMISHSTAMVTMIHFYTTPYDVSIRIQETTELLDLHYHEIYIIRYRHPTHQPDMIIERAERLIGQNRQAKYSVFSCNCEHFCNWCCVGNAKSFQADGAKDALNSILTGITNVCGKSFGVVCRLVLLSLEDVSKLSSSCLINVPWGVLSVLTILYLLFVIYQTFKLNEDRKKGNTCSSCTSRKKVDIWIQFVAYCGLQAGGLGLLSLIMSVGASNGIVLGSLLVCSVLSLVCISGIPKLRKAFLSPFRGRLLEIKSLRKVWFGDVISFRSWNLSHSSVVSAVKVFPGTDNKRGEVRIVHYSKPGIFGRRSIVEEDKTIDLDIDSVFGHDYSGYNVHDPEIVVYRARQRLGETKFKMVSNRSCHFCHWAKVNEDLSDKMNGEDKTFEHIPALVYLREVDPAETLSNLPTQSVHIDHTRGRKHASKIIGKVWARIRDDVQAGQLIEFRHRGLCHKAVTTSVQFDVNEFSKLSVTLVHYGKERKICEETLDFDLNNEDVWIYKYHPLYQHRKDDIIKRARARIHERKHNILQHRSSHFTREVVEKGHISTVLNIAEINPGDVVCFPYWSFSHEAIVSNVVPGDSKAKSVGRMTVIHYTIDVLAPRTIKEETILIDLQKERLSLINYDGYVTYPQNKVIERARSRIGEQRFSICGNTSADFVHWAKVVQYPVIMSEFHHSQGVKGDSRLLVPKAGLRVEEFQRFSARAWSDLSPGIIVEYRSNLCKNQGILSHVDETRNTIEVVQYGADRLFSSKVLRVENMKLDFRHDNIWIYRGHPKRCYKTEVVLANAFRRLGERKADTGKSSWDFCKECVLKPQSPEI